VVSSSQHSLGEALAEIALTPRVSKPPRKRAVPVPAAVKKSTAESSARAVFSPPGVVSSSPSASPSASPAASPTSEGSSSDKPIVERVAELVIESATGESVLTNPTELAAATTTTVQSFFDYVEEWRGALVDMQASLDFTNAEDDAAAQKPTLAAATIVASGGAQRSVGEADDV